MVAKQTDPIAERERVLEQYQLYVEMADRVSQRRDQANRYYSGILAGLLAVLALAFDVNALGAVRAWVMLVVSLVGLGICVTWGLNLNSYRNLSQAKWMVVHELEKYLPVAPYTWEWDRTRKGGYMGLIKVERFVPAIMATPFFVLTGYSIWQLV